MWVGAFSPGLATGLVLLLPAAVLCVRAAARLPGALRPLPGIALGLTLLASQDLWRVLFNSLLEAAAS